MQSGELIVTGEDSLHITLEKNPAEVKVDFKDEVDLVPCSPHNVDSLEFNVVDHHNKFVLVIRWAVTGAREIKWQALY
jgi:hypothetical protein